MKALLGTELGGGFGHLAILAPLARRLMSQGVQVTLALPGTARPPAAMVPTEASLVVSPPLQRSDLPAVEIPFVSYADLLFNAGFGDEPHLCTRLNAWSDILGRVAPDLVVVNHAPFLQMAAAGRFATIALGTGFELPPAVTPFPALNRRVSARDTTADVLRAVQRVQRRRGQPEPETLADLFPGRWHFIVAIPELDPYAADRGAEARYVGPLEPLTFQRAAGSDRVFVYLSRESSSCMRVLQGVVSAGVTARAVVGGAAPDGESAGGHDFLRRSFPTIAIEPAPIPIGEALSDCGLIIHHGGLTLAQQALLSGIPQLVVPRFDEQALTGQALERLGAGVVYVRPEAPLMQRAVTSMLQDQARRRTAAAAGDRLRQIWFRAGVDDVLQHCQLLLRSPGHPQLQPS